MIQEKQIVKLLIGVVIVIALITLTYGVQTKSKAYIVGIIFGFMLGYSCSVEGLI
jgi:hypothetical protein